MDLHVDVVTKTNHDILKNYKIIDTVGAGDCFTGAFAVKLTELDWKEEKNHKDHYREAITFAHSSAFLCITKKGAMPSMPDRNSVDKFMEDYLLTVKEHA